MLAVAEIAKFERFHLMKPHCVNAVLRKHAGTAVQWVVLLDADAVVNPHRFDVNITQTVLSTTDQSATVILPGNDKYDGCSGVFAVRTSARGLCFASLWCREVQNNEYGLWDQTAMWSTITAMYAKYAPGKVTTATCCG